MAALIMAVVVAFAMAAFAMADFARAATQTGWGEHTVVEQDNSVCWQFAVCSPGNILSMGLAAQLQKVANTWQVSCSEMLMLQILHQ